MLRTGLIQLSESEKETLFTPPSKDVESLKQDALELLQKQDVYAMGKSLKEILFNIIQRFELFSL